MNKIRYFYFAFALLVSMLFLGCDSSSKMQGKSYLALRSVHNISDVPTNADLYLEFSKDIDFQTVNLDTFYLLENDTKVDGTLDVNSKRVTFSPKEYLHPLHSYTLVVTKDLLSEDGFGLLEEYHWNFNSLEHADNEAPVLLSLLPSNNASIHTEIALEFNEQVVVEDSKSAIIKLTDSSGSLIAGTSSLESNRIRFSPESALSLNTQYHFSLQQKISDLSGNFYNKKDEWDFNTTKNDDTELLNIRNITSLETQKSILSMTLADDILIVGEEDALAAYRIDSLTCKLSLLSSVTTQTPIYSTVANKNTIYVGTSDGISIFSVSDLGVLSERASYKMTHPVFDLALKEDRLFVAQTFSGAQAFDVSEDSNLIKLFDFTQVNSVKELSLSDNRIYILDDDIYVFTLEGDLIEKIVTSSNIYDLEYDSNAKRLYIANGIDGFSSETQNNLLSSRSFVNNILAIKDQKNYKLLSDYNRGVILYDDSGFTQSFSSYRKGLFGLAHKDSCTYLGYENGTIQAVDIFAPYVKNSYVANRDITLVFNENIADTSITKEKFTFIDEDSNPIPFTLSFDINKTLTVRAEEDLHVKHHYSLHVKNISDLYQNIMLEEFVLNFDANNTDNIAPKAYDDSFEMQEDTSAQIHILDNDIDVNGDDSIDKSSVNIIKYPKHGVLSISNVGVATYQPYTNYYGVDTFEYNVSDNEGASSNTAVVSITINDVYDPPPNQAPIANDDSVTYLNAPTDIYVLDNDTDINSNIDPASIVITKGSDQGSLATITINQTTGVITYYLNTTLTYPDTFRYTIKDTAGAVSNEATVTVNP